MRKHLALVPALVPVYALACVLAAPLAGPSALPAQEAAGPDAPPKVMQIFREEVKPGRAAAHAKVEAGWPRAFAKAQWPTHYLAMTSLSGPTEAWFITGYPSLAAWEQDNKNVEKASGLTAELDQLSAQDGELLSTVRGMVLAYMDTLSYRPAIDLAKTRYFHVITFRVRPGHESDFMRAASLVRGAYAKASAVPVSWAVYQVLYGMPGPTYLVLVPARSLAELDENPANERAFAEAMGAENFKALDKIGADAYVNVETNLFALSPRMSYVPKELAVRDPEFWTPKQKSTRTASTAPRDTTRRARP